MKKQKNLLMYDEIEIKTLPDPNCKLCWGTGKSTQRVSTGVPYVCKPLLVLTDLSPKELKKLKEAEDAQWAETECDCIVKKNVIKANKELKSEKPKIIWNGRELNR